MSMDKASTKPMPPCFLTVRFPSVFLGDGPRERLHDAPPAYEKQGHVFYQTELEFVAEKLLEMFRQNNPVPAAVGEPAYGPKVVFEVVNGADVELTRRVRYMGEVQQLEEIRCIGHPDPEAWALFGLPHDRLTVLLVRHYEQARQWEPLVVAALREGNPRDWGQNPDPVARRGKAFGSSPGGRGRAGQRKVRHSHESAPEKSSSAGAYPPGILECVRQWAAKQADEIKAKADGAELPALYLAAAYTEQAFELAQRAAQWTRDMERPAVAEFVNTFAELHECRNRARELLEGQDKGKVWEYWPAAPGTVYCWKADNSALAPKQAYAGWHESPQGSRRLGA